MRLDLEARRRLGISSELLGLVGVDGKFRHAKCHSSSEDLLRRLEDEEANVAVASTDDWRHGVGLCAECGAGPDEGAP